MSGGAGLDGGAGPADLVHVSAWRPLQALPYDPCPGDVAGIRDLARSCRERAEHLDLGAATLAGWAPVAWRDAAAHATAEQLGRLAGRSTELRRSLEQAGDALAAWASRLLALQGEADALDAEAADVVRARRELDDSPRALVMTPMIGWDPGTALERDRLDTDLRRVVDRAGALHGEYVGASRTAAAALDAAAPRRNGPAGWWRGAWDTGHDVGTREVRRAAGVLELSARTGSLASTVAAVASLVPIPGAAAVAVPLSAGLALGSARDRAVLAVGAGGSPEAVVSAGGAVALSVVGVLGGTRLLGAVGDDASRAATYTGAGLEAQGWAAGQVDGSWSGSVPVRGGGEVQVTVHDVAEPWHIGNGVRGHGFTGVATVAVRRDQLPAPTRAPAPTPTRATSDERDHQHRVGGGGG